MLCHTLVQIEVSVCEKFCLLWNENMFFISYRNKITVAVAMKIRVIILQQEREIRMP